MIHEIARCPYCEGGVLTVEDDGPGVLFGPDPAGGRPCAHLAVADVALSACDAGRGVEIAGRSGAWQWRHGEGWRPLPWARPWDCLSEFIDHLFAGLLEPDAWPAVEHKVVGGTAGAREARQLGSGVFPLRGRPGEDPVTACLDGSAAYAPDPAALMEALRQRSRCWERWMRRQ
jgi:hypothetical protein